MDEIIEQLQTIAENTQDIYTKIGVDIGECVKKTDYANYDKNGIVVGASANDKRYFFQNGILYLMGATDANIADRKKYVGLTAENIDAIVKTGITTNTIPLTDEERVAALTWLGLGDISSALDEVIAMQEELLGGSDSGDEIVGNLINFEVKDKWADEVIYCLEAVEGMTWGEWCTSRFNTIEAYVNDEQGGSIYVMISSVGVADESYNEMTENVTWESVIMNDGKYIIV